MLIEEGNGMKLRYTIAKIYANTFVGSCEGKKREGGTNGYAVNPRYNGPGYNIEILRHRVGFVVRKII
jgi:hypothetical protein